MCRDVQHVAVQCISGLQCRPSVTSHLPDMLYCQGCAGLAVNIVTTQQVHRFDCCPLCEWSLCIHLMLTSVYSYFLFPSITVDWRPKSFNPQRSAIESTDGDYKSVSWFKTALINIFITTIKMINVKNVSLVMMKSDSAVPLECFNIFLFIILVLRPRFKFFGSFTALTEAAGSKLFSFLFCCCY